MDKTTQVIATTASASAISLTSMAVAFARLSGTANGADISTDMRATGCFKILLAGCRSRPVGPLYRRKADQRLFGTWFESWVFKEK